MEYPDLAEVERRPMRYWILDGIPEIVMGGLWIVWGVAFLLPDCFPKGSWTGAAYSAISPAILVISAFACTWFTKKLKNKYTFPRAGYVRFHDPTRSQRFLSAAVACAVAVTVAWMVVLSSRYRIADLLAPAAGALLALGFLAASRRPGMRHFVWYSAASLVLGAALYPLKLGWLALPWFFIGLGAFSAASGTFRFRAFVKSVPPPGGNEP